MRYEIEYISKFNGHQKDTVESQDEMIQLIKSIHHCDGEILDIKSIKE